MAKRKRVLIPYSYNENWIGGTYYIHNLILALQQLPSDKQPEIYIHSDTESEFEQIKNIVSYSHLYKFELKEKHFSIIERIINKISRLITNHNLINNPFGYKPIDAVFPVTKKSEYFEYIAPVIYWIPDFQSYYYPEYFSDEDLQKREDNNTAISHSKGILVFSSEAAKRDFYKFHPDATIPVAVLPFAVTLQEFSSLNFGQIKNKYDILKEYFFCPNQFWVHKNHKVILEAVKILKNKGIEILVLFTGQENDYRFASYVDDLKKYVQENDLSDNIKFLGFIDRREQLKLMEQAIAVIQPSLFEGWSTVVEDAKAMNKFIILSDIDVHKEQISNNCLFFQSDSAIDLADKIDRFKNNKQDILTTNYNILVKNFANDFMKVMHKI